MIRKRGECKENSRRTAFDGIQSKDGKKKMSNGRNPEDLKKHMKCPCDCRRWHEENEGWLQVKSRGRAPLTENQKTKNFKSGRFDETQNKGLKIWIKKGKISFHYDTSDNSNPDDLKVSCLGIQ